MRNAHETSKTAHVGHYIRQWRKYCGFTLEKLAAEIGVTHGAISQLERGQIKYTQLMLEAVAGAFRCEPAYLLMFDPIRDDADMRILKIWRSASEKDKQRLLRLWAAMQEEATEVEALPR